MTTSLQTITPQVLSTVEGGKEITSILYAGETYKTIKMSLEGVLSVTGSNKSNISEGALAISGDKIWYYGINNEYLKYAIIQEILCPDMTKDFSLDSIEDEINIVPPGILVEYIEWRISFFKKMVEYWEGLTKEDLEKEKLNEDKKQIYIINLNTIIQYLKDL